MKNLEKYLEMLGEKVDGLLLTSRFSRHYGAEFDIAEGVAVVTKKGCRYFSDSRYIESAQNNIKGFEVIEMNRQNPYAQLINDAIRDFGVTVLGYEEEYLTVAEFRSFEEKLEAKLVPMHDEISAPRAIKEDWELDRIRKAQQITDQAFSEVIGRIKAGMTEKQLQAELIYCMLKNGADGPAFSPIVVSGPKTSLPHGVPGDRVIGEGEFITMDFGALYKGYCADMTRTVAVGYATEEMEKVYNTVLEAQLAGIAAAKAGVLGKSVDNTARKVIEDAGYGQYFGHGFGHSVGLEIHERPNCGRFSEEIMVENAVASAEPGIYIPGKFGVRIEDVLIYKQGGTENITHSPKNLIIV
jgi:Xaa-Pro aminopeptidase